MSGGNPVPVPAAPLKDFPSYLLRKGVPIYRSHAVGTNPVWYSSNAAGVLTLSKPFGTLNATTDPVTATSELLAPAAGLYRSVTVRQSLEFQVSKLIPQKSMRLANFHHPGARAFGLRRFDLSLPDATAATRRWATALHRGGFAGIIYRTGHDTGRRNTGILLFGGAGVPARPDVIADASGTIPGPTAAAAAGFHVLPHQTRIHLDIIG